MTSPFENASSLAATEALTFSADYITDLQQILRLEIRTLVYSMPFQVCDLKLLNSRTAMPPAFLNVVKQWYPSKLYHGMIMSHFMENSAIMSPNMCSLGIHYTFLLNTVLNIRAFQFICLPFLAVFIWSNGNFINLKYL